MNFRAATIHDILGMMDLINIYAEQGLMLPRSKLSLCETLQNFMVIEDQGKIVGVGGLHILWEDLSEIRSLAIAPDYAGQGLGTALVEKLEDRAKVLGIPRVITLTYQKRFFEKSGYEVVEKEQLSHKVWKDCLNCPKYHACDEIAMIKRIEPVVPQQAESVKEQEKLGTSV